MGQISGLIIAMFALSVNTARADGASVQVVCANGTSRTAEGNLNQKIDAVAQKQDVTVSAPSVGVNSNGGEVTVCVTVILGSPAR